MLLLNMQDYFYCLDRILFESYDTCTSASKAGVVKLRSGGSPCETWGRKPVCRTPLQRSSPDQSDVVYSVVFSALDALQSTDYVFFSRWCLSMCILTLIYKLSYTFPSGNFIYPFFLYFKNPEVKVLYNGIYDALVVNISTKTIFCCAA